MRRWTAGLAAATLLTAGTPVLAWGAAPSAHLTADVNRDGLLTAADDAGRDTWTDTRGAIFLPNLDDDERRCTVAPADLNAPGRAVDDKLAACNDAADDRINGPRDARDLAPLKVDALRNLSATASGTVTISPADKARVFADGRPVGTLTAAQLRRGVRLGLEGRDIVRDPARWDGQITVTLTVTDHGRTSSDVVRLRVAPLMLQNDLQPAQTVLAGRPNNGPGWWNGSPPYQDGVPGEWQPFARTLRAATNSAGARLKFVTGTADGWKDMWLQDTFEPATASMPAAGRPHTMRILIRSGNVWDFDGVATPRPAGRLIYRDLRGPDVGVVQELATKASPGLDDLLNMGGNLEALPPYDGYPQGRIVYGAGERQPDPAYLKMVTSQGYQPPVVIDTSWLMIGHADETTHVVRADNARGWTLAVADPRLAAQLLRDVQKRGGGNQRLFADTNSTSKPTVDSLLAPAKLADNGAAAQHIDKQLSILLKATGLRADELVRLPVFFDRVPGYGLLKALTPGLVNGLSLTDRQFAVPDPHGPRLNGRDVFRQTAEGALARNGVRVHWVENFFWSHLGGGEVHCATNALRDVSGATPWWS
ncbi:protein-arginine deiminase family protein [Kribbella albertanoniae]|uniref:Protein-arginine deiminase n=1 Tax=Kribbella albertanoniae TaxID=1266829 RepID=A0A4R4PCV7_9ACTN|nr:protein-arginine deiminase family protein [Kribbella albertanoniae]TDC18897.1 protein-arginine deiminase [Kribbella albertanoniae]